MDVFREIYRKFKEHADNARDEQYHRMGCGDHPDVHEACVDTWATATEVLRDALAAVKHEAEKQQPPQPDDSSLEW